MISLKRTSGWLAVTVLLAPVPTMATAVNWTFNGTFQAGTVLNPADPAYSAFQPGGAYSLSVSFNTDAFSTDIGGGTAGNPGSSFHTYRTGTTPTVVNPFTITFNGFDCDSNTGGLQPCSAPMEPGFGSLQLFNNIGSPGSEFDSLLMTFYRGNSAQPVDPYFASIPTDRAFWQIQLTGGPGIFSAADLNSLAAVPNFTSFPNNSFLTACGAPDPSTAVSPESKTCGNDSWRIRGSQVVFTAPVPEPATLALLAAGIAGIGFARRRRRAH